MERLSEKLKNVLDDCIDSISEFQQDILDEAINFLSSAENIHGEDYDLERLRELVEKVWRGCEQCNGAGAYSRYAENLTKILLAKYCPHCGRPLTDEAVEMVMERLKEALE